MPRENIKLDKAFNGAITSYKKKLTPVELQLERESTKILADKFKKSTVKLDTLLS